MWVALLGLPLAARKLGHHASHLRLLCNKPDLLPALSHNPAQSLSDGSPWCSMFDPHQHCILYIVHSTQRHLRTVYPNMERSFRGDKLDKLAQSINLNPNLLSRTGKGIKVQTLAVGLQAK